MRILHFSWEYPPLLYGGLGRHVHGLSEAQAAAGHDVVVVSQRHPDALDDTVVGGVRVIRTEPGPGAPSMGDDIVGWVGELNTAMTKDAATSLGGWRPDVVHAHDWLVAQASLQRAHADGVPLTTTIHGTAHGTYGGDLGVPRRRGRHDIEARLVQAADRLIVCSEAMREEVTTAFGPAAARAQVVPNGVDAAIWRSTPEQQAQVRADLGIGPGTPLFVLPARLKAFKGGDVAIDALAAIRRAHPDALLVLAGDGEHEAALRAHAERIGLTGAVRLPGHLSTQELAPLLGAATAVFVPSSYAPFEMTIIEGAAAGTPVVAADVGGPRSIIRSGETGLLIPVGSADALAAAATRLINDPAFAEQLTAAAYRQATTDYTWHQVAAATTVHYDAAVAARGRSTAAVVTSAGSHGGSSAPASLEVALQKLTAAGALADQALTEFVAALDTGLTSLQEHLPEVGATALPLMAAAIKRQVDSARDGIAEAISAERDDLDGALATRSA